MYKQTKWLNWAAVWPFRREAVQKLYQHFFEETRISLFNRTSEFRSFSSTWPNCTLKLLRNGSFQGFGPPFSPRALLPVVPSSERKKCCYSYDNCQNHDKCQTRQCQEIISSLYVSNICNVLSVNGPDFIRSFFL